MSIEDNNKKRPYKRGHAGRRPFHHRVLTPDGGVLMCTTEEDANRVTGLLNDYHEEVETLRERLQRQEREALQGKLCQMRTQP